MAVPNRKRSRTRTRTARGPKVLAFQHRIINSLPKMICQSCQRIKILHRVCLNCFNTNNIVDNKPKKVIDKNKIKITQQKNLKKNVSKNKG